ncbi:hypothetical protein MJM43_32315, partial [Salmonella enterica subsp. enterica serovar Montevideo]|nr:hypothetical protein [Salmonella enterica subsp. enterica serovar Montevideo]
TRRDDTWVDDEEYDDEYDEETDGVQRESRRARILRGALARRNASKENSQEAHEAIRPSDVAVMAESLKDMEADAQKLYQLIWR